jgi:3-deoxy-D-manno-octulosonic-acid transferase
MENFIDIAKLFLDAGAAMQIRKPEELAHAAWLLENSEARERMGASARQILERNSGATARTVECLRAFLMPDAQSREPLPREAK